MENSPYLLEEQESNTPKYYDELYPTLRITTFEISGPCEVSSSLTEALHCLQLIRQLAVEVVFQICRRIPHFKHLLNKQLVYEIRKRHFQYVKHLICGGCPHWGDLRHTPGVAYFSSFTTAGA